MRKWIAFLILLLGATAPAAEHKVSSAKEIDQARATLKPGDELVMADGTWTDQNIWFIGKGTADHPITLRAQTPGKVILSGKSSIAMEGSYLVLSGVLLDRSAGDGDGIIVYGDHCRITDCAVVAGQYKFFVHIFGENQRIDHCYLAGKTTEQPTLQIEVEEKRPNHNQIDHNHFGPRPPLGKNGGETMRVGYSYQSMFSSASLVEQNLFDRCDGEIEIISSKSCDNIYRGNTFLNCAGMLTLRHGNRCTIDGNYFLGGHKRGSGGIRIIGEDHTISNNYIEAVNNGAFWITSGIPDSPLKGYFRAQRCTIAFNTVVDCKGPLIDLDAGMGSSGRTLMPENITIANNLFAFSEKQELLKGKETETYRWIGNLLSGADPKQFTRIKVAEVKLSRGEGGLLRPANDSPVRGAGEGASSIQTDIDGQLREGRVDVGCDQISDAPVKNHPLTASEVGPGWMDAKQREATVGK